MMSKKRKTLLIVFAIIGFVFIIFSQIIAIQMMSPNPEKFIFGENTELMLILTMGIGGVFVALFFILAWPTLYKKVFSVGFNQIYRFMRRDI